MRIAMMGTGRIGFGLGPLLVRNGHEVMFGSRNPELVRANVAAFGPGASVGTIRDAALFGDVLFTAVPWHAVPETLKAAGPLKGKIVVDCTNPLTREMELAVGCSTSAAEETARL